MREQLGQIICARLGFGNLHDIVDHMIVTEIMPIIEECEAIAKSQGALDEAKWWEHLAGQAHEDAEEQCGYCERIRILEAELSNPKPVPQGGSKS